MNHDSIRAGGNLVTAFSVMALGMLSRASLGKNFVYFFRIKAKSFVIVLSKILAYVFSCTNSMKFERSSDRNHFMTCDKKISKQNIFPKNFQYFIVTSLRLNACQFKHHFI